MPVLNRLIYSALSLLLAADSFVSATTVCTPNQCVEGTVNSGSTIGAVLSRSSSSLLLLPGQYSTSSPEAVASFIGGPITLPPYLSSSSSAQTASLPFSINLVPGATFFPASLFQGSPSFQSLNFTNATQTPTQQSVKLGSFLISPSSYAILQGPGTQSLVLWDPIPDVGQIPNGILDLQSGSAMLLQLESSSCSTACSTGGRCTADGACSCKTGFNGSSCESCASGFYGPTCLPCPEGCATCDEGSTGSGRCLSPVVENLPATCNCNNGVCGGSGSSTCTCKAGWTTSSSSSAASSTALQCSDCATGFFKDANSQCQACTQTCAECAGPDGHCTQCLPGLKVDPTDPTRCTSAVTTTPATTCQSGTFLNTSGKCTQCSPLCKSCSGPTSNDCIACGAGTASFNGACVNFDSSGVCANTAGLVVNNGKGKCDTCPDKCTTCGIPNFSVVSKFEDVQCTGCLPGFVLSQGRCVAQCPRGSFVGPDGVSCQACDSKCATCAGTSYYCLTCSQSNAFALQGDCATNCPPKTFKLTTSASTATSTEQGGMCGACHGDCDSCSGSRFDQCVTCPKDRPVLSGGRCLRTCAKNEFFDSSSGAAQCKACSSSCATCTGAGDGVCLSCDTGKGLVLQQGKCVPTSCPGGVSGVATLGGICLATLAGTPTAVATVSTPSPSPSPAAATASTGTPLWKYLLIGGCCLGFVVLALAFVRWRAREQRAMRTKMFNERIERQGLAKDGFLKTAASLWGGTRNRGKTRNEVEESRLYNHHHRTLSEPRGLAGDDMDLEASTEKRVRAVEDWRHRTESFEMENTSSSSSDRDHRDRRSRARESVFTDATWSTSSSGDEGPEKPIREHLRARRRPELRAQRVGTDTLSIYSQVTSSGAAASSKRRSSKKSSISHRHQAQQSSFDGRTMPEPRQPLNDKGLVSRFSNTTLSTNVLSHSTGSASVGQAHDRSYPPMPLLPSQTSQKAPTASFAQVQPLIDTTIPSAFDHTGSSRNHLAPAPAPASWLFHTHTGNSSNSAVLSHATGSTQLGDRNPFRHRMI